MSNNKVNPLDWFNFISQSYNSNALIHYVLTMDKPIDFLLLREAMESCMQRVPRLACRFEAAEAGPVWSATEASPDLLCSHVGCDDLERATQELLAIPIDAARETQVKLYLLQCGVRRQRVVLKMHHAVSDAMGGLLLVRMLAQGYTWAEDNARRHAAIRQGTYTPAPLSVPPEPDLTDILRHFAGCQPTAGGGNEAECDPIWQLPTRDVPVSESIAYRRATLSAAETEALKLFAAAHGSNLNATLMAAYYQSLLLLTRPSRRPHAMQFTMDLRRYDEAMRGAVGNLSTILNADFPPDDDFGTLASEVKQSLDRAMQDDKVAPCVTVVKVMEQIGLPALTQSYARDWKTIRRTGCCIPMISNLGRLDDKPVAFGASRAKDFFVVPPAFRAPALMLAPGSYGGVLSLIVSFHPSPHNTPFASRLLETMKALLLSAIGKTDSSPLQS